jgi:flagellar basal body rod protein FlgF
MAACTFTIPFAGDTSIVLDKAKIAVEKQSGSFTGDTNNGNFQVSFFGQEIVGGYTVAGNELNIVIESKPFMVPCNAIESFLKSQIV